MKLNNQIPVDSTQHLLCILALIVSALTFSTAKSEEESKFQYCDTLELYEDRFGSGSFSENLIFMTHSMENFGFSQCASTVPGHPDHCSQKFTRWKQNYALYSGISSERRAEVIDSLGIHLDYVTRKIHNITGIERLSEYDKMDFSRGAQYASNKDQYRFVFQEGGPQCVGSYEYIVDSGEIISAEIYVNLSKGLDGASACIVEEIYNFFGITSDYPGFGSIIDVNLSRPNNGGIVWQLSTIEEVFLSIAYSNLFRPGAAATENRDRLLSAIEHSCK